MKRKAKSKSGEPTARVAEPAAVYGLPMLVNVRAAKDALSGLLEKASRGEEVIITSDGKPKARLVAVRNTAKPFRVDWALLKSIPWRGGKTAEQLIREERDSGF
jgi:prevent-host-death family protein